MRVWRKKRDLCRPKMRLCWLYCSTSLSVFILCHSLLHTHYLFTLIYYYWYNYRKVQYSPLTYLFSNINHIWLGKVSRHQLTHIVFSCLVQWSNNDTVDVKFIILYSIFLCFIVHCIILLWQHWYIRSTVVSSTLFCFWLVLLLCFTLCFIVTFSLLGFSFCK